MPTVRIPQDFWPKALYVHVPFCASRCPYCDFYLQVSRDPQQHRRFVQRVLQQLDNYLQQRPDLLLQLQTIYLGGGTPSLLGAGALSQLLQGLKQRVGQRACSAEGVQIAEMTLESNPELVCRESLDLWRQLGITRLSIGLQSHSDHLLRRLGRRSSVQQHEELATCLQRHFAGEYSFDFIYGIPGQGAGDIQASLDFIARSQPQHVSYYELGIEDGTLFGSWQRQGRFTGALAIEPERSEGQLVQLLEGLCQLGYHRYEVANFARSSPQDYFVSRHNLSYWRWQPYLGLGPSAVGAAILAPEKMVPKAARGGEPLLGAQVWRIQGTKDWDAYYRQADFGVRSYRLGAEESLWEYLLMALRLRSGLSSREFCHLFWPQQTSKQTVGDAAQRLAGILSAVLPKTMHQYGHFFCWQPQDGDVLLQLSEQGFDLQGALLRSAYFELEL